ncbi:Myosin-10 [Rhizoctonia solani]|uniref:Myosin-10 n=1 Tax=Rhizoctonia solani TaxID=456999 RepID=A0A0K6FP32_9AGAM|nr:Myosin-10 [Rhizoctonia solani]
MPRNIYHTKKARSAFQKAHSRKLVQYRWKSDDMSTTSLSGLTNEPQTYLSSPHTKIPPPVSVVSNDNDFDTLKQSYKNIMKRDERSKLRIESLQTEVINLYRLLSDARNAQITAEHALSDLQMTVEASASETSGLQARIDALERIASEASLDLSAMSIKLQEQTHMNDTLVDRQRSKNQANDTMRKRIERLRFKLAEERQQLVECQSQEFELKNQLGIVRPEVRDMLRKLACEGVANERAIDIVHIVAECLGVTIIGSVSARSIPRIMLEGLVQARMQVAHELSLANYVSICGDGTTIKNQQHEAKGLFLSNASELVQSDSEGESHQDSHPSNLTMRTLGVEKAISHTAQQQLDGWITTFETCCDALKRSPLGQNLHVSSETFALKLRGILTDHAADQKRLVELMREWKRRVDRQVRAVPVLRGMSTEEQLNVLSTQLDNAQDSIQDWRALPEEEQSVLMHDAWLALAIQLGDEEFKKMSSESQFEADLIAWTGCCMHKELNAVKGGVSAMSSIWKAIGSKPPISLPNKLERMGLSEFTKYKIGSAVKLTALAGALFNHKDDKRGYQSTVDYYFEKVFGYSKRFADTSHTRYGSHCDAAAELILHLSNYIGLLLLLGDAKNNTGLTNIEQNLVDGLQDIPMLTELVVLALYGQAVGKPYMRHVRSAALNSMDLGPFHNRVKQHCQAIINNPDLLLGADTSYTTGTLDGQSWDRPEVIYCVLSMVKDLPDIRPALVAFFEGALKSWERFTVEYDDGGIIAQATAKQRKSAWVSPTNDVSEGALGQCRQMLRRAPTMTDEQRNARVMWKHNHTYDWARQTLTQDDQNFVRTEARRIDASGSGKKVRMLAALELERRAEAGRARKAKTHSRKIVIKKKLAETDLNLHATHESLSSMKIDQLDSQIDKLREADKCILPKSKLRTKQAKIAEILRGLERCKVADELEIYENNSLATSEVDMGFVKDEGDDEGYLKDEDMYFDDEIPL